MRRVFFAICTLFIYCSLQSHPWKPSHYVIIDTDGGIDDIRTLTLLLGSPDVRVLAITISPGALSATNGYIKVKSLANSFYHEGVPVGINRISDFKSPDLKTALNTKWGDESGIDQKVAPDFLTVIGEILNIEKTKISFICLGSLSSPKLVLEKIPVAVKQIKEFILSSEETDYRRGFNYNCDKISAEAILNQQIPVKIVQSLSKGDLTFYNKELIDSVCLVKNGYARKITAFFNALPDSSHTFLYSATDEMTALYLHYPTLFDSKSSGNLTDCFPSDISFLRSRFLKILMGETAPKNQVIKMFPEDQSFYYDDINPYVSKIIDKYGIDEWSSGVLSNELHRHLGVFAIIGVKMGIRAREFFNTGVDEFRVKSFAGSTPPVSCFNDGLQVSTGATPGHGLLTVIDEPPSSPAAEFSYMNRKIRLSLKPGITQKIREELKEIDFVYGLDSNIYWELVRKNSLRYWLSMDRHEIFDLQIIN